MNKLLNSTNRQLLREVYHDAPNMLRDRNMATHDKIRFFAHHNSLVRLDDNNHELLGRLAKAPGNPGLQKAANSPGWIHFAADHPRLFRFGADTGLIQAFS